MLERANRRVEWPDQLVALGWILLFAFAAALTLQQIGSFDYWWHLRTGQLMIETGSVPHADTYTYTAPGSPWIDIHWLFQLGLYGLYSAGGHTGVVIGKFVLAAVVLALLAPLGYQRNRPFVSISALAFLLVISCTRYMPRPELVSFVLLAALLRILDRFDRTNDAWIYAIIPLQLLWVNVHGLFALGIAICGMYFIGELGRSPVGFGGAVRRSRLRRLGTVTALATLICVANPNGIEGTLYPLQQLEMVSLSGSRGFFGLNNMELQPAIEALAPLPLALFLGFVALCVLSWILNCKELRVRDALVLVAFIYLAFGAIRNVPLLAIAATPILVRNWNAYLDARAFPTRLPLVAGIAVSLSLALLVADTVGGRFYARLSTLRIPGFGIAKDIIPTGAVDWIEHMRPPGPIAHHMQEGGYLIWKLYPEYRVMADGRLEVFGPERFHELMTDRVDRFKELDAKYHFGVALVRYRAPGWKDLLTFLQGDRYWRLTFIDDVAALFVRVRPGEDLSYPEIDLDAPDLFASVEDLVDARAIRRLTLRAAALSSLGRDDLARDIWRNRKMQR